MNDEKLVEKEVEDLGAAAYLLMYHYKVIERRNRAIVFLVEEKELNEFEAKHMEYLCSDFHRFDSCLMSLKKLR